MGEKEAGSGPVVCRALITAHAIHGKIQQSKKTITDSGFAVYVNVRKFSISSNEPMQLLHI